MPRLGAQVPATEAISGQQLIYSGRFDEARAWFAGLAAAYPRDPAGPMLEASALIWWGEAQDDERFQKDTIDLLLGEAVARARVGLDSALGDSARARALFWLGSSYGYRARQADLYGSAWGAARDAKAMRDALERALALDSSCADCLLGLGLYDYALARAGAVSRLVAKVIGLGSGDAQRALARMRRAGEEGVLTRTEALWVYASALLRESEKDPALREEAVRRIAALAAEFPDNPVFQRALAAGGVP